MLGKRVRVSGHCLYIYEDEEKHDIIWEYYDQFSAVIG
jgi:hypothetical protein